MESQDIVQNLIDTLGQSQRQRFPKALARDYVEIDERDAAQLLAQWKRFAAEVQFHPEDGGAIGDWQDFFPFTPEQAGTWLQSLDANTEPHLALMLAFFRNEMGFGGNNGLTDFKDILGYSLQSDGTRIALFIASGMALAVGYLACRALVKSRLGRVAIAIRDTEDRTRFIGYKVEHVKLAIFTFSAMLAGLAGALYVPQVGIINPGEFAPLNSIEVVIWVAMGGRATLYGAVLGAIGVNYAKTWFTAAFPEIWLFALGGLFVLVTLLLPRGIAGLWRRKGEGS